MSRNTDQLYKPCAHIKRTEVDNTIDEELTKDIAENYRTVPTFEKTVFEYKYRKHYSLERNELLKCRWRLYRDHLAEMVYAPFQFPDVRDLHFYNNAIRFLPALSVYRFPEYRRKLKPGPGVDNQGQMPIPVELLMKRGIIQKEDKHKDKSKKKLKDTAISSKTNKNEKKTHAKEEKK